MTDSNTEKNPEKIAQVTRFRQRQLGNILGLEHRFKNYEKNSCYLNHPTQSVGQCYAAPIYRHRYMENDPYSDVLQQGCGMFGTGFLFYKGYKEAKANTSQKLHP